VGATKEKKKKKKKKGRPRSGHRGLKKATDKSWGSSKGIKQLEKHMKKAGKVRKREERSPGGKDDRVRSGVNIVADSPSPKRKKRFGDAW